MAFLKLHPSDGGERIIPIVSHRTVIGRQPECDVVLESLSVSRHHAALVEVHGKHFIEDLKSKNGTFVNGVLVAEITELHDADVIDICDEILSFHTDEPETVLIPPAPETWASRTQDTRSTPLPLNATSIDTYAALDDSQPEPEVVATLDPSFDQSTGTLSASLPEKVHIVMELSQSICSELRLADVQSRAVNGLLKIFPQADVAALLSEDSSTGDLQVVAVQSRYKDRGGEPPTMASRTVAYRAIKSETAILSADAVADARFDGADSVHRPRLGSTMCVPLISRQRNVLGAIQVAAVRSKNLFSKEDLAIMVTIASQVTLAVENARLHEEVVMQRDLATQRTQALKRSNEDLERFGYTISHDLQAPIRAIRFQCGELQKLLQNDPKSDASQRCDQIQNNALRLKTLIRDLLEYSRVSSCNAAFNETDTNEVLQNALENLELEIRESGAQITYADLPHTFGDWGQLVRLFQNLIHNAIKFCSGRTPVVHVEAQREEDADVFSVRDNGIGISGTQFERVFEIFERLHTQEEFPGTGAGLAIAQRIVERHGGRIWIESEEGKGSTFFFRIPRRSVTE